MHDASVRKGIISDIEVLRAYAVGFTVFQHIMYFNSHGAPLGIDRYLGFWGGVDIFFAISGFVIGKGLMRLHYEHRRGAAYWGPILGFWIRRIWRIWPTAWLWAFTILLLSAADPSGYWGPPLANLKDVVSIITNTANIYFHYHIDCLLNTLACGHITVLPYWSLSLEEQFYLLLPFILFFARGKALPVFLTYAILLQFFLPRPASTWSLLWALRSDALFFGVFIAWSMSHPGARKRFEPAFMRHAWLRPLVIILLLCLILEMGGTHSVFFSTGIIALVSAALVWCASFDKNYVMKDGPVKRVLVWIGTRSYAIYIIHFLSLHIVKRLLCGLSENCGHSNALLISCGLLLAVALADLNYRFIETPLRLKGAAIAKRYTAPAESEKT